MTTRAELAEASRIQASFGLPEHQNRWTILFRWILVIPHSFVFFFRAIAIFVLIVFGWFYALVMGRLPTTIASYVARYVQYITRVYAYTWLMLDRYPPFALGSSEYPIKIEVHPVRVRRLSVLFRYFLLIPAGIVASLSFVGLEVTGLFIWLIVLVTGQMPRSLFDAVGATLRFQARYQGYALMVSSAYPGELFGDASVVAFDQSVANQSPKTSINLPGSSVIETQSPDQPRAGASKFGPTESQFDPQTSSTDLPEELPESAQTGYTGGPRYAFPAQNPMSREFTSPPLGVPSQFSAAPPIEPSRKHAFVVSKAGKRILVLFLVLGLFGLVGDVLFNVRLLNNRATLSANQDSAVQLATEFRSFSTDFNQLTAQAAPCRTLVCVEQLGNRQVNDIRDFESAVGDLNLASPYSTEASRVESYASLLVWTYHSLYASSNVQAFQSNSTAHSSELSGTTGRLNSEVRTLVTDLAKS